MIAQYSMDAKIALFIPCYVDQLFPEVGIAVLSVFRKLGVSIDFPEEQTCCGQPLGNSGFEKEALPVVDHFKTVFSEYDYVVAPSGSCIDYVLDHHGEDGSEQGAKKRFWEFTEFMTDVLKVSEFPLVFPRRIGIHQSCHGLRSLELGKSTEKVGEHFSKPESLLSKIGGLELVELERKDECCGFGGAFCVDEPAVSGQMGMDRIQDHVRNGTEVLTGVDMSCLMHLKGTIERNKLDIEVMHIAQIMDRAL